MRRYFLIWAFALWFCSPAAADFQAGVDAYNAKNFSGAMAAWLPLAEAGDPIAQNAIGALYDHGLGVEESDAQAVEWYRRAADQNFPLAMRNLGEKYLTGHGVTFDKALGEEWLRKAASMGDAVAAQRLSVPAGAPLPAPENPQPQPIFANGSEAGSQTQAAAAAAAEPSAQLASVSQPAPSNLWILGQWQGPNLGCPPQGGLEFDADRVLSYYQGKVTSELRAQYETAGDEIGVSVVGIDGASQAYRYRRMDDGRFRIAAVPESMPPSMVGVEFARCGPAPAAVQSETAALAEPEQPAAPAPSSDFEIVPEDAEPVASASQPMQAEPTAAEPLPQPVSEPVIAEAAQPAPEPVATPEPEPVSVPEPSPTVAVVASTAQPQMPEPAPANPLQAGWKAFSAGDSARAIELWRPEAEAGNVAMQLLIGSIYDYGQGVPQDDAQAIEWYRRAAAKGSAKAQFLIGATYARSSQIADPVKGLAWLKRAEQTLARSGKDADGDVRLAQIQALSKQVAAQLSSTDVAKAGSLSDQL